MLFYPSNDSDEMTGGEGIKILGKSPGSLVIPFKYGRVDFEYCNDTGYIELPSYSFSDMKTFFEGRFGLTQTGAVKRCAFEMAFTCLCLCVCL